LDEHVFIFKYIYSYRIARGEYSPAHPFAHAKKGKETGFQHAVFSQRAEDAENSPDQNSTNFVDDNSNANHFISDSGVCASNIERNTFAFFGKSGKNICGDHRR
jgi:hypothetical protein